MRQDSFDSETSRKPRSSLVSSRTTTNAKRAWPGRLRKSTSMPGRLRPVSWRSRCLEEPFKRGGSARHGFGADEVAGFKSQLEVALFQRAQAVGNHECRSVPHEPLEAVHNHGLG